MITTPTLEIRCSGPAVTEGRMAIDDLATIARTIERALVRIAEASFPRDRSRSRGSARLVAEQCRLFLVGWGSGSAVATFEAGRAGDLLNEIADRTLDRLMGGLASMAPDRNLGGTDREVLAPAIGDLVQLGNVLHRGVWRIELKRSDRPGPRVVYDPALHERLSTLRVEGSETRRVVVTGRLDRLDGHDGLAGTLWEDDGTAWTCTFSHDLGPLLARHWMRRVRVEGEGRIPPRNGRRTLRVENLELDESELEEATRRFWSATSLRDLAREQAVAAIGDVDELLAVWSEERLETDPFEELMAERRRRRETADAD